jgi:hypothetical protein
MPGDLAWLNERLFHIDLAEVCAVLDKQLPSRFAAPAPGDVVAIHDGEIERRERASWVRVDDRDRWPAHDASRVGEPLPDLGPWTGRKDLTESERTELFTRLRDVAAAFYEGPILRALYTLGPDVCRELRPTIALALRGAGPDGAELVLEYDPTCCGFVEVKGAGDPSKTHVAGAKCWASDLLETLRVSTSPGYMAIGRMWEWNAAPREVPFVFETFLLLYAHPLRRPDEFLSIYRRVHARVCRSPI